MFSIQPISRLRRSHQTYHRCTWLYLSYSFLVACALVLLSFNLQAEQEFYTWIDEYGRVHNTPIKPKKEDTNKKLKEAEPESIDAYGERFFTEDGLKDQVEKERKEKPPFFTHVDGQGSLRSEFIPQSEVELDPATGSNLAVTDHMLLATFRLPHGDQINCCQQYSSRFNKQLQPMKSLLFIRPQLAELMPTKHGNKPAWYFKAPALVINQDDEHPVLSVKIRGTDSPVGLIALDVGFKPLHYLDSLYTQHQSETWRSVAYDESLISVVDDDVAAFVVYFVDPVPNSATIELKWLME